MLCPGWTSPASKTRRASLRLKQGQHKTIHTHIWRKIQIACFSKSQDNKALRAYKSANQKAKGVRIGRTACSGLQSSLCFSGAWANRVGREQLIKQLWFCGQKRAVRKSPWAWHFSHTELGHADHGDKWHEDTSEPQTACVLKGAALLLYLAPNKSEECGGVFAQVLCTT